MNFGYIIDLNGIVHEESLRNLELKGLFFEASDSTRLSLDQVLEFRKSVLRGTNDLIDKHLFFFVIDNDNETLKAISDCISAIQKDIIHFNQSQNELHIICNLTNKDGF